MVMLYRQSVELKLLVSFLFNQRFSYVPCIDIRLNLPPAMAQLTVSGCHP